MNLKWDLHIHHLGGQLDPVPYLELEWHNQDVGLLAYIYYERNHYVLYYDLKWRGHRYSQTGDMGQYYRLEASTEELAKEFAERALHRALGG